MTAPDEQRAYPLPAEPDGRFTCSVEGCKRARRARDYCRPHYNRWHRNGDPGSAEIGPRLTCSVPGCERAHKGHGYCNAHYQRWRQNGEHGSAGIAPTVGHRKEVVRYESAHARVSTAKGSASEHPCRECGETAAEWAYLGGCPDEITEDAVRHYGLRYSLDVSRYVPMCVRCHRRFDHRETQNRAAALDEALYGGERS